MPRQELFNVFATVTRNEELALDEISKNKHKIAIMHLKDTLNLLPTHPIAYFMLALCYERLLNPKKAQQMKAMAIKLSPANVIFHKQINQLADLQKINKEILSYLNARASETDWKSIIRSYNNRQEYILAYFVARVIDSEQITSVADDAAMTLFHIGQYKQNLVDIRSKPQMFGNCYLRDANTAALAVLSNADDVAEHYAEKCLATHDFYRAHYIKSFYLYRTGRHAEAILSIRKSIEMMPKAVVYQLKYASLQCLTLMQLPLFKQNLEKCLESVSKQQVADQLVMESFWYPFLYFCAKYLLDRHQENQITSPLVQEFASMLSEFLIRGNVQRAQYSKRLVKLVQRDTKSDGKKFWLVDNPYERYWSPFPKSQPQPQGRVNFNMLFGLNPPNQPVGVNPNSQPQNPPPQGRATFTQLFGPPNMPVGVNLNSQPQNPPERRHVGNLNQLFGLEPRVEEVD